MLKGKKILLGITGSIAAYKSAFLARLLVQSGAEVKVVMSPAALEFVTPLTFATLSKNPVHSDFTENKDTGEWNHHVGLALWADLMLMAPLSADTLSKMAHAQCDNFLMAVYMSARCPVMVAPAMDHDMFLHPGTQENLSKIKSFGHIVLAPNEGELASGLSGKGRMEEPEEILQAVVRFFNPDLPLSGKRALVTAGPTYEKIDPVRFVGNFSSGKMGVAIAETLASQGADVVLVAGPVKDLPSQPNIRVVKVTSAHEMHQACLAEFDQCDITVMAAAVADYKPATVALEKVKKKEDEWALTMVKTVDIASDLGSKKRMGQVMVGFALETENEHSNAALKLSKKNLDMIVLNSLKDEGAGFGTDTNKITLIWPGNKLKEFGLKPKSKVAEDIVQEICQLILK
ncbi:MAG: bifunctional phosphopantothenoylcysteine decarboxylase/phosphopantothenate--cysteine ligase CoaBC [Flavobacteriales bacterium]|nr:bifunctional phosphopantothenoylcysteine decarboxylase/phosphopantothenate--cysteine ligase CoaBC [Flavobacteriales bacterium]